MQSSLCPYPTHAADTGSAHWANHLDFGGSIFDNCSQDEEAESTRNTEAPAADESHVLKPIVAWSLELLWRCGTALTKTLGLCRPPIASPNGPFATQTTSLMDLPEELLLQILLLAVPDKLAGPWETPGQFVKSDLLRATYCEYHASMVVSRPYHNLARDAFFSIYMHEIWILYTHKRKRKVHEGVQVYPDHRSEIKRLKLRLCSSQFFGLNSATEEVQLWLDMFPRLREVQVFVGTLEHKSLVRELGPQVWECLMDWQERSKVERSSRVKIKLVFQCNDRRWVWDESGEARNVKLRYPGVGSPMSQLRLYVQPLPAMPSGTSVAISHDQSEVQSQHSQSTPTPTDARSRGKGRASKMMLRIRHDFRTACVKSLSLFSRASPNKPTSTQKTFLMDLPEELIQHIMTFAIPEQLANCSDTRRRARSYPSHLNRIYRRYENSTLVSHDFRRLAEDAFYWIYTHEIRLEYGVGFKVIEHDALTLRPVQWHRIKRLKLSVRDHRKYCSHSGVLGRAINYQLQAFIGLRVLHVGVETLERSSRIRETQREIWEMMEQMWPEMSTIRQGLSEVRPGKMMLTFDCLDRHDIWRRTGEGCSSSGSEESSAVAPPTSG
ncbi:hypothetical protein LTR56_002907 [Elasticomyces elasticus]|nr:hypothetical protein LTR56_002907 [Elasticomyces elasticus]KAK4930693.1 hypothetical protein LTR49_002781 [Elasticomyces elasticus]KAK5759916.1 hypothetical protein LTS12_009964 [Elasticomyces elasticus]